MVENIVELYIGVSGKAFLGKGLGSGPEWRGIPLTEVWAAHCRLWGQQRQRPYGGNFLSRL